MDTDNSAVKTWWGVGWEEGVEGVNGGEKGISIIL